MAEKSIFMDTNVFTDIVNDIQGTASECVFSEAILDEAKNICGTISQAKLYNALEEIHRATYLHEAVASTELPTALLKLRDSMIAVDDALSKNLTVKR